MKRLILAATVLPVPAFAHGVHVALPAPAHEAFHGGILAGLIVVAAAFALAWLKDRRP
ncbi:hypothetical protein ACRDNQ_04545 [Palleronia sp. KMU-117]|uniref:hypothetical protein n=1 Tax=Palleronia sp. KMU-117 TaxID=3434108 RepID=UPI003D71D040